MFHPRLPCSSTICGAEHQSIGADDEARLLVFKMKSEERFARSVVHKTLSIGQLSSGRVSPCSGSATGIHVCLCRLQRKLRRDSAIELPQPSLAAVFGVQHNSCVTDSPTLFWSGKLHGG